MPVTASSLDILNSSLSQLRKYLAQGEISSVELTRIFLKQIDRLNPALNAFITLNHELALSHAEKADQARREAKTSRSITPGSARLLGIPIAHKDIFVTSDLRTTCGSRMLEHYQSPFDADVVERMRSAGMVLLGKTNMDEFAMGSSNETSWFGAVRNPWDQQRVPGGSSGGSAVCVASRMSPAATGTDTGGSIRQPAALCGISGIKPTYGLVSRYGMIAFASSLDQGGPMARSADDLALLLDSMVGFDPRDSTSLDRPAINHWDTLQAVPSHSRPLEGLRIGYCPRHWGTGLAGSVSSAIANAWKVFENLGAERVEIDLPHEDLSTAAYYVIAPAEASSNLSRFDGVRYGYRTPSYHDLEEMYQKTRTEGFGNEVKRRILIGTYVLSQGYYDAYYIKAQQIRRLITDGYQSAFAKCDLILSPTTPSTAFLLGEKQSDPVQMYLNDIYTIGANLAGLPALSIPCGFDEQGLPIGVHLLGNYFTEANMLRTAHCYQQETTWHQKTPSLIA